MVVLLVRTPFIALALIICAASGLAACASAPIDMVDQGPSGAPEQAALRTEAARLSDQVDRSGWTLAASASDGARAFFGRLIGGSSEDAAPSPISVYLEALDADADTGAALLRDAEHVTVLTAAVAEAASGVVQLRGGLGAAGLDADIAAAESALGASRRAHAFFKAVAQDDRVDLDDEAEAALDRALTALNSAEDALADAADGLAERRWSARARLAS